MKNNIFKYAYFYLIASILTILTIISLIFYDVPYPIYANNSGLALVSMIGGPIPGSLFCVLISIGKNISGLIPNIISPDLLRNISETMIISFIFLKNLKTLQKILITSILLSIFSKPLYFLYYLILSEESYNTFQNFLLKIKNYFVDDFFISLITYIVSIFIAVFFYTVYKKIIERNVI